MNQQAPATFTLSREAPEDRNVLSQGRLHGALARKLALEILIAPPEVLGLLRQYLNKEVAAVTESELAKNLVGYDLLALKGYLSDLMPV